MERQTLLQNPIAENNSLHLINRLIPNLEDTDSLDYDSSMIPQLWVNPKGHCVMENNANPFCNSKRLRWLETAEDLAKNSVVRLANVYSIRPAGVQLGLNYGLTNVLEDWDLTPQGELPVCWKLLGEHTGIVVPPKELVEASNDAEVQVTLCTYPIVSYRPVSGFIQLANVAAEAMLDSRYMSLPSAAFTITQVALPRDVVMKITLFCQ